MYKVIGIKFKDVGKTYYFNPGSLEVKSGDSVLVETSRGVEYGHAVTDIFEEKEENLVLPLKSVKKIAGIKEKNMFDENKKNAKEALAICQKYVEKHNLEMQLIDSEYTFNREQLIFYFVADGRIDFRELVKDLASEFKTRIELRQVGVRDEAKVIGGIGPCGLMLCCSTFLGDFSSVSINMAKTQNLSLNPTKISGLCGRLLCCLTYENDTYIKLRKGMPDVGKKYETKYGIGKVLYIDILNRKFKVDVPNHGVIEIKLDDVE